MDFMYFSPGFGNNNNYIYFKIYMDIEMTPLEDWTQSNEILSRPAV